MKKEKKKDEENNPPSINQKVQSANTVKKGITHETFNYKDINNVLQTLSCVGSIKDKTVDCCII